MWVHLLPGRARARVGGLRGRPVLADRLEQRLLAEPGVRAVSASAATGTVLICYDPAAVTLAALGAWLQRPDAAPAAAEVAAGAQPPAGLTGAEVERQRARYGDNTLPPPAPLPFWRRLLEANRGTLQSTLLAGTGLSLLAGQRRQALTMGTFLALGGVVGAWEAGKAPAAHAALRQLHQGPARVLRDGAVQMVCASELVPGDLLLLTAGDQVPADAAVLAAVGLGVDEGLLTGESAGVAREPGEGLHAGTAVVQGRCTARVVATGPASTLGQIAGLLEQRQRLSPGQAQLERFVARATRLGLWLAAGVVGVSVWRGQGLLTALLSGVALAISAVPEGLPASSALAMAHGADRLQRQGARVQSAAAVETMGAVTVLCCDKTGTLTHGEMTVTEVWLCDGHWDVTGTGFIPEGEFRLRPASGRPGPARQDGLRRLLGVAALCNNAHLGLDERGALLAAGDPTDLAFLVAALKAGLKAGAEGERLAELPFDPQRRRMLVVYRSSGGKVVACAKGAAEQILPRCSQVLADGNVRGFNARLRRRFERAAAEMAGRGHRVLAVAYRSVPATVSASEAEADLILVGLAGLTDPPRPEAAAVLAGCRQAGVRPVLVTGDHPATALAVARQLDLPVPPGGLLSGEELARLSDTALDEAISGVSVVARATPGQKLRVVRSLRRSGQVVAMVGDGVGDAPAIAGADVGIAMGERGSAVARAAAALVLAEDRLETVLAALRQGRATQDNIRRASRYLLGMSAAAVSLLALGSLLALPLPLLPAQLLWLHLAGEMLPAAAISLEPPAPGDTLRPRRQEPGGGRWEQQALGRGLRLGAAAAAVYAWSLLSRRPLATARTLALATLAAGQVRQLLAAQTPQRAGRVGPATAAATALTLGATCLPPLRGALQLAPLGLGELSAAALAAWAAGS